MRLYNDQPGGTTQRARQLRREAPEPERRLLRALREAFPDLKWRHQVPVGRYYADILCFTERLVIEVDGDTHGEASTYDAARTRVIESKAYRVIRVTNTDVMHNLEGTLTQLSFSLREKEGAHAQHGKDEGDRAEKKDAAAQPTPPSPFHRLTAAPSLSRRAREKRYSSSSNVTATSPFAESRTVSPSTSATSPSEMK